LAGFSAGTYRPNFSCLGSIGKALSVEASFAFAASAEAKGLSSRSISAPFLASGVVSAKLTALNFPMLPGVAARVQRATKAPNARSFMVRG